MNVSIRVAPVAAMLGVLASLAAPLAKAAEPSPTRATSAPAVSARATAGEPSAEAIVERSTRAHGGLEKWRKLESTFWKGRLESERLPQHTARFEVSEKQPNKQRFEILDPAQKSLRVFDGTRGWKLHAGEDGRPNLQQFTDAEVRYAREAPGLEGPIVAFALKGDRFVLVGRETVEGQDCYRLAVRLGTGEQQTVWVNTKTNLEVRYDRIAYGDHGPRGIVSAFYRDYRVVEGLAVPSVIEIGREGGSTRDRMLIDEIALNPKLPDLAFSRPGGVPQSHEVNIRPSMPDAANAGAPRTEVPATPK